MEDTTQEPQPSSARLPTDTGRVPSQKQLDHLASIRGKAAEARRRLRDERLAAEAEVRAKIKEQMATNQLASGKLDPDTCSISKLANLQTVKRRTCQPNDVRRTKAVARPVVASETETESDSSASDSDSGTPSPPPTRRSRKGLTGEVPTDSSLAKKLLRMERELWKLKFKERYAKKAVALAPTPPPTPSAPAPIVVQVPEQRKAPSDAASLAREALALANFGSGPDHRSSGPPKQTNSHGFGGYGRLF